MIFELLTTVRDLQDYKLKIRKHVGLTEECDKPP